MRRQHVRQLTSECAIIGAVCVAPGLGDTSVEPGYQAQCDPHAEDICLGGTSPQLLRLAWLFLSL
jgi:hypothetical protein